MFHKSEIIPVKNLISPKRCKWSIVQEQACELIFGAAFEYYALVFDMLVGYLIIILLEIVDSGTAT